MWLKLRDGPLVPNLKDRPSPGEDWMAAFSGLLAVALGSPPFILKVLLCLASDWAKSPPRT